MALALTVLSGPIVIEIGYRVEPGQARRFYDAMTEMQRARQRNGAFEWSLARDIADPAMWIERYHCPTWGDYLRQRSRLTQSISRCTSASPPIACRAARCTSAGCSNGRSARCAGDDTPDARTDPIVVYAP